MATIGNEGDVHEVVKERYGAAARAQLQVLSLIHTSMCITDRNH